MMEGRGSTEGKEQENDRVMVRKDVNDRKLESETANRLRGKTGNAKVKAQVHESLRCM
jgi:hypothetical protein